MSGIKSTTCAGSWVLYH